MNWTCGFSFHSLILNQKQDQLKEIDVVFMLLGSLLVLSNILNFQLGFRNIYLYRISNEFDMRFV